MVGYLLLYMNSTVIKFLITLIFVAFVLTIVSIAWPRFMQSSRPEPIAKVYQAVSQTQFGKEIGTVLGVSVEGKGEPFNLESEIQRLSTMAMKKIEDEAKTIIARNAVIQLKNQYDTLPIEMKTEIQNAICSPSALISSTSASTSTQ
jgi:hypothetical protein